MESHKQIEDHAAALLTKRDSGIWTERDQAHLTAWMEEATAHRVAVLRLELAWEEARRLKALGAGLQPGAVPPPGAWRHTPFFGCEVDETGARLSMLAAGERRDQEGRRRGRTRIFGVAAAALLAIAGGYYIYTLSIFGGDRYATPIGGVASVPLQDGSNITLNTSSKVHVALGEKERRIDLEQGEAFFEVAKDPMRPFVVRVGSKQVVAVGTKFSVSRENDEVRVVVTEGTVRFEDSKPATAMSKHREESLPGDSVEAVSVGSANVFLEAGTIARATDGALLVQKTSLAEAEEALSWRQGYLTFHETTLADAIDQFNRYNKHKMSIDDPGVAAIRISGTFRPTNYQAFVRLLQDGFSIHASTTKEETRLTK